MLWAMAAQIAQAELAPKRPEGMWASGPSMRSAKVVSMIAWRRWVISAAVAGSVQLGKNGGYRQIGSRPSAGWLASLTRRTIRRAGIAPVPDSAMVEVGSATSASESEAHVTG